MGSTTTRKHEDQGKGCPLLKLSVACADVGSVARGRFGWAIRDLPGELRDVPEPASIQAFADTVIDRLAQGRSVALGFECPLFVPLRKDPTLLTRGREGDGNRPWSAGAGCGSLTTGLVETAWTLDRIRKGLTKEPRIFFDWAEFSAHRGSLFLWEAFVTGKSKSDTHRGDAALAVQAFCRALPQPESANRVNESRVYSLIGAALLRTGWSVPASILSSACLVVAA